MRVLGSLINFCCPPCKCSAMKKYITGAFNLRSSYMQEILQLFSKAGVELNGPNPWDVQVHDDRFYERLWIDQSLGLGESYMEGWWDSKELDGFIEKLLRIKIQESIKPSLKQYLDILIHKTINFQSKERAKEVAERHYNLGNELYMSMLDPSMNYSCGYWKDAKTLEEAQQHKMELICRKLMLRPGLKLLDIGCGWGGLAKYAAQNFGVEVVGLTISQPQKQFAEEKCRGLPVKIFLEDYRDEFPGQFDRIVSVGMFEHVGYKNYRAYMDVVDRHLKKEGIFLLHTIGSNVSYVSADPWIHKYIFPNGMLPSIAQIGEAIDNRFVMEDWHNFGAYYDKTLMAWHENFNKNWPKLKHLYDERFYRMWNYYLLSCAGAFRARSLQLWQIVLTKDGIKGGFKVRDL